MIATDPELVPDSIAFLSEPLTVGDIVLPNRVFMAPMSGVSDLPFRRLAIEYGAGLVISEMVASEQLALGNAEAHLRALAVEKGPHVVQLAGREARWMAEGARAAEGAGADIIDINMGCPAKKVTSGYSGSALMRDLDHAEALIEATVAATARPVTLKMRLGWDTQSINASELARRAESAGVQMVTVHGRTRCQFFDGTADWLAVAAIKANVTIPVIINGDIGDLDGAARALAQSGADGIMIGRAACGRPWLLGALAKAIRTGRSAPLLIRSEIAERAVQHHRAIIDHYGSMVGIRAARKHIGWYLDRIGETGAGVPASLRGEALRSKHSEQVEGLLRRAGSPVDERRAAA